MQLMKPLRLTVALAIALTVTTTDAQVRVSTRVNNTIAPVSNNVPQVQSLGPFGGQSIADTEFLQFSQPLSFQSTFSTPPTLNTISGIPSSTPGNFTRPLNFGTLNTLGPSFGTTPTLTIPPLSSNNLQIPSFASPSSTLPGTNPTVSPLGNTALPTLPQTPQIGNLLGASFDEEELIGTSPIFGPSNNLGFQIDQRLTNQSIEFARSLGIDPRGTTNFGLSPWSSITDLSPPSNLAYQDRDPLSSGFDRSIPSLAESGETGRIDPLSSGLPRFDDRGMGIDDSARDSIFTATDALDINNITSGQSAWDDNPLIPQRSPASGPLASPAGGLYGQMKQSVATINAIKTRTAELEQGSESVPSMRTGIEESRSFLINTDDNPLTTFTSDSLNPAEQFTTSAEQNLRDGKYYRALAHYEVAMTADRSNPLIQLGQGIAYIGAGEYNSAVRRIERAIDMFPEIAYFKFDLTQFITDADLLDVRRADLETKLTDREDYRYRFLLGFMEYYMGLQKFGLENLKKAAANAPESSAIARFPQMLKSTDDLSELKPADATEP